MGMGKENNSFYIMFFAGNSKQVSQASYEQ